MLFHKPATWIHSNDGDIEFQIQVGATLLFPEYRIRGHGEPLDQPRRCIGMQSCWVHNFDIVANAYRYDNKAFEYWKWKY